MTLVRKSSAIKQNPRRNVSRANWVCKVNVYLLASEQGNQNMCVVAEVGIALACESGRRAHAFPSHAQQCAKQLLLYTSTRRGSSTERRLHGIQLE